MVNERRLTWKRSLDGYEDVGLREGVTVGEAICKLADLEERETVEVVHGQWVWKDIHGDGSLTLCCSECLESEGARETAKYCQHCGAKMDGGK